MTNIVPVPVQEAVPVFPALGSANFNGEAYTFGSRMPVVSTNLHNMAVSAWTNATAAMEQADAALGYRNAANNSANAAAGSASTAQGHASTASTQAGIATTQAGIASTKAGEAAASANAAAASAASINPANLVPTSAVGSAPNQVPVGQMLGALAFADVVGATQVTRHARDSKPGDVWHEYVSDTQLIKKFHGFDNVIRTITETYA